MSSPIYQPPPEVENILAQASVQLDGTTDVVKISNSDFNKLDHVGQEYIKQAISSSFGYSVEFFFDSRVKYRVYLGNLNSINRYWPCDAWIIDPSSLPVLYWKGPCVGVANTSYFDVEQPDIASPPDVKQPNPAPPPQARECLSLPAPQIEKTKRAKRARPSETIEASRKPAKQQKKRVAAKPKVLDTFNAFKDQDCGVFARESRGILEEDMPKPAAPQAQKNTPRSGPVQLQEQQQKGQGSPQPVYATHGIMEHINGRYPRIGDGPLPTSLSEYSLPTEAHNEAEKPGQKECSQPQIAEEGGVDLLSLANRGFGSLATATPVSGDLETMEEFVSEPDASPAMHIANNKLDGGKSNDPQVPGFISPSKLQNPQSTISLSTTQNYGQNYGTDVTGIPGSPFQGYTRLLEDDDPATQYHQICFDDSLSGLVDEGDADEDCLQYVNLDL